MGLHWVLSPPSSVTCVTLWQGAVSLLRAALCRAYGSDQAFYYYEHFSLKTKAAGSTPNWRTSSLGTDNYSWFSPLTDNSVFSHLYLQNNDFVIINNDPLHIWKLFWENAFKNIITGKVDFKVYFQQEKNIYNYAWPCNRLLAWNMCIFV